MFVSDSQGLSNSGEIGVRRPEFQVACDGRREKLNIDPSDSTAMQLSRADKRDNLAVRNRLRPMHPVVIIKKLFPASFVTNKEFSVDKFVPHYFIESKKSGQLVCIWRLAGEGADPD